MSIINICQNKRCEILQDDKDKFEHSMMKYLSIFATVIAIIVISAMLINNAKAATQPIKVVVVDKLNLAISKEMKLYRAKCCHSKKPLLEDSE